MSFTFLEWHQVRQEKAHLDELLLNSATTIYFKTGTQSQDGKQAFQNKSRKKVKSVFEEHG